MTANEFRPLYIEINQLSDLHYTANIKTPPQIVAGNQPKIQFPASCKLMSLKLVAQLKSAQVQRASVHCQCKESIAEKVLTIVCPDGNVPNTSVVKIHLSSAQSHTILLTPGEIHIQIPRVENISSVAKQYTWPGVEHIWAWTFYF